MMPDATQQHLKAPKARRWYRPWGWQVLLLLLAIFLGWFTWAIIELNETASLYSRLEENASCSYSFTHPDWVDGNLKLVPGSPEEHIRMATATISNIIDS